MNVTNILENPIANAAGKATFLSAITMDWMNWIYEAGISEIVTVVTSVLGAFYMCLKIYNLKNKMTNWQKFLEYRRQFFKDYKGLSSMMRKMSHMIIVFVVIYPFALIYFDVELTTFHVTLELGLAGLAFGAKVTQKKLSEKDVD